MHLRLQFLFRDARLYNKGQWVLFQFFQRLSRIFERIFDSALICWKQPKMESNMSKFPDSSTQNIDQVNLLVESIGENNSNKNDNFSHKCQNISNKLMFDRMIMNHFQINASNYWKLSKIWVMIELKNPTLNSVSLSSPL